MLACAWRRVTCLVLCVPRARRLLTPVPLPVAPWPRSARKQPMFLHYTSAALATCLQAIHPRVSLTLVPSPTLTLVQKRNHPALAVSIACLMPSPTRHCLCCTCHVSSAARALRGLYRTVPLRWIQERNQPVLARCFQEAGMGYAGSRILAGGWRGGQS